MPERVVLVSIPGLRRQDLAAMPNLARLAGNGEVATLVPSFPCVTCPVQANMTTGAMPREHGVVANGFYWRDKQQVEMWTAWNECIERPQIWERLHQHDPAITSALWFPLHSKGAKADYICTPAPIHNPDGSESLWCYTKPTELYGTLRDRFGHFPLMNFWGPLAGIKSTAWIVDSAVYAAGEYRPNFFYIYLPHLDYAAQRTGPDSDAARKALGELDETFGRLVDGFRQAYGQPEPLWLVASEYTITPVDHVTYPNRVLREAGMLAVESKPDGEYLDLANSAAWALVDHQFSHIFVRDAGSVGRVVDLFRKREGIAEVLAGDERARYELDHPRSGEVVLVSSANSWQAYYWWQDDARAPPFARTVDIHRKPGYDPVELHFDPATKSIPLDARRVRGSHGAPARDDAQRGIIVASQRGVLVGGNVADTDVFGLVLRQWGV
ncbi:MAG TPA: nucleotide pyrophosphatase/phosphodiesterase family protein [Pirellulales bacterium]|jgi:predicted AlkP superfamily pyrophosphatase or phosphodiesterase|nr:nucleotide pyrophosphatase/phosphodiesterase family protein [Pirellulales bacterium]